MNQKDINKLSKNIYTHSYKKEDFISLLQFTYNFLKEHIGNKNIKVTQFSYSYEDVPSIIKQKKEILYCLTYFVSNILIFNNDKDLINHISDKVSNSLEEWGIVSNKLQVHEQHSYPDQYYYIDTDKLNDFMESFDSFMLERIDTIVTDYKNTNKYIVALYPLALFPTRKRLFQLFNKKALIAFNQLFENITHIDRNFFFMTYMMSQSNSNIKKSYFYDFKKSYTKNKKHFTEFIGSFDYKLFEHFNSYQMSNFLLMSRLLLDSDEHLSSIIVNKFSAIIFDKIYNKANTSSVLRTLNFLKSRETTANELLKYPTIDDLYSYQALYSIENIIISTISMSFPNGYAYTNGLKLSQERKIFFNDFWKQLHSLDIPVQMDIINSSNCSFHIYGSEHIDTLKKFLNNYKKPNESIKLSVEQKSFKSIHLNSRDYFNNDKILKMFFSRMISKLQEKYPDFKIYTFEYLTSPREQIFFIPEDKFKFFDMNFLFNFLKNVKHTTFNSNKKQMNMEVERIFIDTELTDTISLKNDRSTYMSKKI